MYDVLVGFSINKEETVVDPADRRESKITLESLPRTIAGSSLNVVRMLDDLGHKVKLLCTVGRDNHAPDISESLSEWRIDAYLISVRRGTPRTIVMLPEANPRGAVLYCHKPSYDEQALAQAAADVADQVLACQPKYCVATGVRPEDLVLVLQLFDHDGYRVLNPNVELIRNTAIFAKLVQPANLIIMNHEEASAYLGKGSSGFDKDADIDRIGHELMGHEVIVTMNSHGSRYIRHTADGNVESHYLPAFATNVVDPTGAGDVYLGAYLSARLASNNVLSAMRFASAAAAAKVGNVGGSTIPTRAQIQSFLRGNSSLQP